MRESAREGGFGVGMDSGNRAGTQWDIAVGSGAPWRVAVEARLLPSVPAVSICIVLLSRRAIAMQLYLFVGHS